MILRFFALQTDLSDYEDKLSKYLDKYIATKQNPTEEEIALLKDDFTTTLNKCLFVFDNNPFVDTTKQKQRQSLVYYDLLMWSFRSQSQEFLTNNKQRIVEKFNELCNDIRFTKTLSGGLQLKSSILRRRALWSDKLSTINGYNAL